MSATYSFIRFATDNAGEAVSVTSKLSFGQAMGHFDDKPTRQSAKGIAVVKDFNATEPMLQAFYSHGCTVNAQTLLMRAGYFGLAEKV